MILDVQVIVECDGCGEEEHHQLDKLDEYQLHRLMQEDGWKVGVNTSGKYMKCPGCVAMEDAAEDGRGAPKAKKGKLK